MKLVNDSCFTCISSKGFKRFLDSSPKYVYSHNISNDEFTEDVCNIENKEQKIVIGFVGSVRYWIFFLFGCVLRLLFLRAWAQLPLSMWNLGSLTRDQTRIFCIARQILNRWSTREIPTHWILR